MLEDQHTLRVAAKAYTLSSELMRILMHSRVLNEEPLILRGDEIAAAGKRADPQSLLCYGNSPDPSPECRRFSIPRTFNASLSRAAANSLEGSNGMGGGYGGYGSGAGGGSGAAPGASLSIMKTLCIITIIMVHYYGVQHFNIPGAFRCE